MGITEKQCAVTKKTTTFDFAKLPSNIKEPLLLQGDCVQLLEKIPDASIDAIITDPPYFLGMTHNGQKACFNDLTIAKPFYTMLFTEYKRVLKTNGAVFFFTDWRGYAFYYPIFDRILHAQNCLVWDKLGRPSQCFYGYGHELILFAGQIKKSYTSNVIKGIKAFNQLTAEELAKNCGRVHPTQKPIKLIERLITDATVFDNVVLDSFMGSGTTGVACINTGRRFIGMELDENYFEIAKKRIETQIKDKQTYPELFEETIGEII